jgi:hypothetical protein
VVYQVGFPFVIFTGLHLPWIAFGIAFHLGIAVVMGLISFSATMIGLLLFTIRDGESSGNFVELFQPGPTPRTVTR